MTKETTFDAEDYDLGLFAFPFDGTVGHQIVHSGDLSHCSFGIPMSMKHRRGNREVKKPKQNKPKVIVSTSPFASASSDPAKGAAAKRK